MEFQTAPEHIRQAVRAIIVGHMASALVAAQTDLGDAEAVRSDLETVGFGEESIAALKAQAIKAAKAATTEQEG